MAGGRLGAAALRRVGARVRRSWACFGVSLRVCRVCRRRCAVLRAPVGSVEKLIERLWQDPVPANAAIEAGRRVGGAAVTGAGAAFHQDLSPPRGRARPAFPVHDVLSEAVR